MKLVALAAIVAVLIVPAALASTPTLNGTDARKPDVERIERHADEHEHPGHGHHK